MHPPGWDPMFAKLTPPWAACAVSRRFLSHSWQLPQVPLSHTLEDALIQQLVPQQAMAMCWGVQWLQCFHPIPCFDLLLYTFIVTVTFCPCGTISGTWERQSLPSGSVEVSPRNIPSRWHTLVCSISLLVNHIFRPQLCGQRRHNAQLTSSSCDSCTWPEQGLAEMLCVRFPQTLRFWGNYTVWHILGQTHMHAQNMLPIVFLRPEVLIPHVGMNADHWAWNFDPQVAILLAASCFPRRLACLLLYLAFTDCTCLIIFACTGYMMIYGIYIYNITEYSIVLCIIMLSCDIILHYLTLSYYGIFCDVLF